jgi:hypothetical protein
MGKARERRLLVQMRKADARKKSTLLIKNYVETVMGGEPLLTELEAFTLRHSFASDEERQEYNTMLSALKSLSGCIEEVRVKHLEVMMTLTFLGTLFGRAKEYRNFEENIASDFKSAPLHSAGSYLISTILDSKKKAMIRNASF